MTETLLLCLALALPVAAAVIVGGLVLLRGLAREANSDLRHRHGHRHRAAVRER